VWAARSARMPLQKSAAGARHFHPNAVARVTEVAAPLRALRVPHAESGKKAQQEQNVVLQASKPRPKGTRSRIQAAHHRYPLVQQAGT
jgi:hypothetical protein